MKGVFKGSDGRLHDFYVNDHIPGGDPTSESGERGFAVLIFIIGAVIGYFIAHNIVGAVIGAIVATVARFLITVFEAKHPVLFKLIIAAPFVIYIIYLWNS